MERILNIRCVGVENTIACTDATDDVGNIRTLLVGADGAFIEGRNVLIDGAVTAAYWYGELAAG